MLSDLDIAVDAEIVKENLQAVQAIYFAYMLEEMRVYQVVERIAQLFQQGLLPLAEGSAAKSLRQRVLEPNRLSALGRAQLYSRVLGAPLIYCSGLRRLKVLWCLRRISCQKWVRCRPMQTGAGAFDTWCVFLARGLEKTAAGLRGSMRSPCRS